MKKIVFLFVIAFWNNECFSQIKKNHFNFSFEAGVGLSEFRSSKYSGFFKFDLKSHNLTYKEGYTNHPGIAFLSLSCNKNRIGQSVRFYSGEWGYYTPTEHEFHGVNSLEYLLKFRLIKSKFIQPSFVFGVGWRSINYYRNSADNILKKYYVYEFNIPMGLSARIPLWKRISLIAQINVNYAMDGFNTLNQTVGLSFDLTNKKIGFLRCPSL